MSIKRKPWNGDQMVRPVKMDRMVRSKPAKQNNSYPFEMYLFSFTKVTVAVACALTAFYFLWTDLKRRDVCATLLLMAFHSRAIVGVCARAAITVSSLPVADNSKRYNIILSFAILSHRLWLKITKAKSNARQRMAVVFFRMTTECFILCTIFCYPCRSLTQTRRKCFKMCH